MASASLLLSIHGALVFAAATTFYILIIFLFAIYFLWLRPQRKKLRATQQQQNAPEVGDDVVTAAGIIGRVVRLEGDRAEIEVAPGQNLTILRTALGRRLSPIVPESADDQMDLAHHDHDGHDHDTYQPDEDDQVTDEIDDTPPQKRWWPGSSKDDDKPEGSN